MSTTPTKLESILDWIKEKSRRLGRVPTSLCLLVYAALILLFALFFWFVAWLPPGHAFWYSSESAAARCGDDQASVLSDLRTEIRAAYQASGQADQMVNGWRMLPDRLEVAYLDSRPPLSFSFELMMPFNNGSAQAPGNEATVSETVHVSMGDVRFEGDVVYVPFWAPNSSAEPVAGLPTAIPAPGEQSANGTQGLPVGTPTPPGFLGSSEDHVIPLSSDLYNRILQLGQAQACEAASGFSAGRTSNGTYSQMLRLSGRAASLLPLAEATPASALAHVSIWSENILGAILLALILNSLAHEIGRVRKAGLVYEEPNEPAKRPGGEHAARRAAKGARGAASTKGAAGVRSREVAQASPSQRSWWLSVFWWTKSGCMVVVGGAGVLLILAILYAAVLYLEARTENLSRQSLPYIPPMPSASPMATETPTGTATPPGGIIFTTLGPTATATPDYAKLGLPSPTPTPTLDYPAVAAHYLTPQPAVTYAVPTQWMRPYPTSKPTAVPVDPLTQIMVRKLPPDWRPTPPPLVDAPALWPMASWEAKYIQAATDLMNFTDADPASFLDRVKAWNTENRPHRIGEEWLLKEDFDRDGQFEWLVSVPYYFVNPQSPCCSQYLILFEKAGDAYRPVYFVDTTQRDYVTKVILVDDLNGDILPEIVIKNVSCGTACSMRLTVGEWDGYHWKDYILQTVLGDDIQFIDMDGDGKTEILISYISYYKLDSLYPPRPSTDIYGWRFGQLVLLEQLRQPTTKPYGIMRDIFSALSFGKIQEALDLAQPVLEHLDQTCGRMETYIGIEAMLAYGAQGNPQAVQGTLSSIMAHCDQPDNQLIEAANVLWQAYQEVHDPRLACDAMKRFMIDQIRTAHNDGVPAPFFDPGVMFPDSAVNFCPLGEH